MIDYKDPRAVLEVCEKATPGPWEVREGKSFGVQSENKNIAACFRKENEQFIALSRQALPFMAAEVERLRAEKYRTEFCEYRVPKCDTFSCGSKQCGEHIKDLILTTISCAGLEG